MKLLLAMGLTVLLSACALDPGTDSIFGTKYDRFTDRMYACAQRGQCQPFMLDSVLAGAPAGITVVPVMKQDKFNGADGYVNLASRTITMKVIPGHGGDRHMITVLNDELDHLNGKRHANDTISPVRDERKAALERERSAACERMKMPCY